MALRDVVLQVGTKLKRTEDDLAPYLQALEDNWYDTLDAIAEATVPLLMNIGLPQRFAVELLNLAQETLKPAAKAESTASHSREPQAQTESKGKGKSKSKTDEVGKGKKGKGKGKGKKAGREFLDCRIPVDLTGIEVPFKHRLVGAKGKNVHHIQDQTGATIEIAGRDEDGMLEFVVTATDQASLDKAASMCEDLTQTMFRAAQAEDGTESSKGKSSGKGKKGKSEKGKGKEGNGEKGKGDKGKGKSSYAYEDDISVDTNGIDTQECDLRHKMIGEYGVNIKHVEKTSNSSISLYESSGAMTFRVRANTEEDLAQAKEMCEDLSRTVLLKVGGKRSSGSISRSRSSYESYERSYKVSRNDRDA